MDDGLRVERRGRRRGDVRAVGVVACPSCGAEDAHSFHDGDSVNFRCLHCHTRWLVELGQSHRLP